MKQSEIEHIIEKRFEKINAAFDKVRMHLNEDDISLFRVKVKKSWKGRISTFKGHEKRDLGNYL